MSGGTISASGTRAEALTIQSSTEGMCIPWLRGMHRLPGNLLWYGDFRAVSTYEKAGGKGGSPKVEKVSYEASFLMGICHGPIQSIPRVWKGKGVTTPAALGLSVLTGALGQSVWSPLLGRGDQSLGYSGLVCVGGNRLGLGPSASIENHSFEVRHPSAYGVSGVPDVDPSDAARDLLTDATVGAGVPASMLGDWSSWSDYCRAADLLMSPVITTQVTAREALETVADLTNTAIVWSGGQLRMVPYGDATLTGNGRTFTPNLTPVYELDDSSMLSSGDTPLKRQLKTPADRYNQVPVEFKDRLDNYAVTVVTAKDLTDINANGLRPMGVVQAHWITRASVARQVAEVKKQRSLLVLGQYTVRLPWHYALIECMDLLTLTDSGLGLEKVPVRVVSIVEEGDDELTLTCEDYPSGVANAPLYATQGSTGFATDALAAPPSVANAVLFEAPGALAEGAAGVEVWAAVRSPGSNWGGCTVWVSLDGGSTYRAVARLEGGSRMGQLSAPLATSGSSVQLSNVVGQLNNASAADAAALTTLCYLGSAAPEYVAYTTAALTGVGAYTLGGLVRGAADSFPRLHASGTPFVRVDEGIAKSGALDETMVGKLITFKLTSFNLFGAAEQSLADVSPFAYTVTGRFRTRPPALGSALNTDPLLKSPSEWEHAGQGTMASFVTITDGIAGDQALQGGAGSQSADARVGTPLTIGRRYRISARVRAQGGANGLLYVRYARKDAGNVTLTQQSIGVEGVTPSGAWQLYAGEFVAAAGDEYVAPRIILNFGGTQGVHQAQDIRLEDITDVRAALDAAGSAAQSAATANSLLATMRSNGFLDAAEKPAVVREWLALQGERAGIVAQANVFGIVTERNAYTSAHDALSNYLNGLSPSYSDTTTDTPITPATDQATWTALYNARQVLLNRTADEAAKRANWTGLNGRPADDQLLNSYATIGMNRLANSEQSVSPVFERFYTPNGGVFDPLMAGLTRPIGSAFGWNPVNIMAGGATDCYVIRQTSSTTGSADNDSAFGARVACDLTARSLTGQVLSGAVQVSPGARYVFSAYVNTQRCAVKVGCIWIDADGNNIGSSVSAATPASTGWCRSFGDMVRLHVAVVAPANAARGLLFVRKYDTISGQTDSYVFVAGPMIEEVNANVSVPSPYVPGPTLDTRQLGYTGDLAATQNRVFYQEADPAPQPDGTIWVTSTKSWQRVGGVWRPYVGPLSVGTSEIANTAVTEIATFFDAVGASTSNVG